MLGACVQKKEKRTNRKLCGLRGSCFALTSCCTHFIFYHTRFAFSGACPSVPTTVGRWWVSVPWCRGPGSFGSGRAVGFGR